jgi:hypothetical protein
LGSNPITCILLVIALLFFTFLPLIVKPNAEIKPTKQMTRRSIMNKIKKCIIVLSNSIQSVTSSLVATAAAPILQR